MDLDDRLADLNAACLEIHEAPAQADEFTPPETRLLGEDQHCVEVVRHHGLGALKLPAVPRPICDAGTVKVTIRLNYAQEGPDAGQASTGALFLMYHQPDGSAVQAGGHAFPQNTPAGSTGTREVVATIPADRLAAGEVYAVVSAENWQKSFNVPPRCKAWTFSEWSAEYAYDVTGCPDLPPPPLAQLVKVCPTDPIPVMVEPGKDTEVAVLCNTDEDGTVTQFLRAYQVDSESGQVGVVADTLLDGITPYEPLGEVGVCQPEPCASTVEILKLCDLDPDVTPNEEGKRCAVPFLRHLPGLHAGEGVLDAGADLLVGLVVYLLPVREFLSLSAPVGHHEAGARVAAVRDRHGVADGGLGPGFHPCLAVSAVARKRPTDHDDQPAVGVDDDLAIGGVPVIFGLFGDRVVAGGHQGAVHDEDCVLAEPLAGPECQ